jgi:hypothetical protein
VLTPLRSLVAAAAVLGVTVLALSPSYQQNDDPVMAMIVSGTGVALEPDPHLMFTHIAMGRALAFLYTVAFGMPWYGLYLLAAHLLAQAGLIHALTITRPPGEVLPAYIGYWVAAGIYFPLRLQFTSTGLICVQAGVLLALVALTADSTPGSRRRRLGAASVLVVLGAAIRFDALLLGAVSAAPATIIALRPRRDMWRTALAFALAVAAVTMSLEAYDRAVYQSDPGWRSFRELNVVRARMVDYQAGAYSEATSSSYARLGWSENDAYLLANWFYPDPAVFPLDKMQAIVGEAPAPPLGSDRVWTRLREAFHRPALLPVLLMLPLLCGAGPGRRSVAWTLGLGVVLIVFLAVFLKAPDHVVMPLVAFAAAVGLVHPGEPARRSSATPGRLALALAIAAAALSLNLRHRDSVEAQSLSEELHESLARLDPRPDRLYAAWAGHFPYKGILPLESPSRLGPLRLYSLGWLQRSPIADRILGAFGISDLFAAWCERDDVFLIAERRAPYPLEVYGHERYGLEVRFEEQLRTPAFPVFGCEVTRPEEGPPEALRRAEGAGP